MADNAFQQQYRDEFIAGFEQRQSYLRSLVTTDGNVNGRTYTFLVADSGAAEATTRGSNGLIPARSDNLNQFTATLNEWHDLVERTGFNLYASQGDGRRIMQESTMAVLNRKVDQDIIAAGLTATQDTGAAATFNLDLAMYGVTILGNNAVPFDNQISCIITPAAFANLMKTKEFSSVDWSQNRPFDGASRTFTWAGVNWIVHPNLPGKGTNAEKCIMFHKSAIGHGCDMVGIAADADYNREQDYSWARATAYMGSAKLQNSGIVIINHDGSGYAAQ